MAKAEVKVSVTDADKVRTLIELLHKHESSLPSDLILSLHSLSDCDACEINGKYLEQSGHKPFDVVCFVDGAVADGVVSANPILRRVTIYPSRYYGASDRPELNSNGEGFEEKYIYPKLFRMESVDGKLIVSWGRN